MRRYWLNREDERPPIRYKKAPGREHRVHKEFSTATKKEKFNDVGKQCEICSTKFKKWKDAHYHHIMSLSYAFHYFPDLTDEILRSKENCQVICEECHLDIHKNDSLVMYSTIAQNLLHILEDWEPPQPKMRKTKKNKRKRRNKEQWEKAFAALEDKNSKQVQ